MATHMNESKIHGQVANWLRHVERTLGPGDPMIWTSVVNEGRRGWKQQAMIKSHGMRKGWPDLTILHGGELLCIELKAAKGRLSPEQRVVGDVIIAAGGRWAMARSLEETQECLRTWNRNWPLLPEQQLGLHNKSSST